MQNDTIGIYFINLATRPDRRAFMEEQLARLGLEAERIEATTPDQLTNEQIRKNCLPHRPLGRAPGEIACSLSHIAGWKRFLASEHKFCLILEDDAVLSTQLPAVLSDLVDRIEETGVLKLDAMGQLLRLSASGAAVAERFEIRRLYSGSSRCTAYMLDRATADRLLHPIDYLHIPVDLVLFDPYGPVRRRVRFQQLIPAVAVSLDLVSHPGIGRAPHLSGPTAAALAISDLQNHRNWRENTEFEREGLASRLERLRRGIAAELIAGPSKFMQDVFWNVRKHLVPFEP